MSFIGWRLNHVSTFSGKDYVMTAVLKDDTELFKQFMDNDSFRRWLADTVFGLTYQPSIGEQI